MTVHRFDVGAAAVRQAEQSGDWSGIAVPAEWLVAAQKVVEAADKAKDRGQAITPTGVRIAISLLRAVLAGPPGGTDA